MNQYQAIELAMTVKIKAAGWWLSRANALLYDYATKWLQIYTQLIGWLHFSIKVFGLTNGGCDEPKFKSCMAALSGLASPFSLQPEEFFPCHCHELGDP